MKFEDAMKVMRAGGKVRRPAWKSAYIFLNDEGIICCADMMPSSKRIYQVRNVTASNIVSDDWEEVLTDTEKVIREVEAWSGNGHE